MANRRLWAFALRAHDDANWQRAQSEARPVACDVQADGIGLRRLQLVVCPSIEPGQAWEIRACAEDWWLFRSNAACYARELRETASKRALVLQAAR